MSRVAHFVLRVPFGVECSHYPSSFTVRQALPNDISDDCPKTLEALNSLRHLPEQVRESAEIWEINGNHQ